MILMTGHLYAHEDASMALTGPRKKRVRKAVTVTKSSSVILINFYIAASDLFLFSDWLCRCELFCDFSKSIIVEFVARD